VTNIINQAEEAKHNAIYRLEFLASKAERNGDLAKAEVLRQRAEYLRTQH